jgi:uncharacterized protein YxjI
MSTTPLSGDADALAALASADRLLLQQIFKPIGNEYRISVPTAGETVEGTPILFVKQKRMSIREDIRFRTHPDRDEYLFMIKSQTMFEFRGRHDVLDAQGTKIGQLSKSFGKSLLRSHWTVEDAQGVEVIEAEEKSLLIALVRRAAGLVSDGIVGLLTFLPFNFLIRRGGVEVGHYGRVMGAFRDRYVLEIGPGLESADRRLLVAFMVALDALQDR